VVAAASSFLFLALAPSAGEAPGAENIFAALNVFLSLRLALIGATHPTSPLNFLSFIIYLINLMKSYEIS
jgi:hypothetical protein